MKNDIILFAIMFAVSWIGYNVATDRLDLSSDNATVAAGENSETTASASLAGSNSPGVVASQSVAASTTKNSTSSGDGKSAGRNTPQAKIEKVLMAQVQAWNQGDLDGFMNAYWNDKSLTISGAGNTTVGWAMAYANYRERYPEGEMGTIEFKDLKTEMVGKDAAFVTGRFVHQLRDKKVSGNFSLVMKLIYRQWKIVQDHTSVSSE